MPSRADTGILRSMRRGARSCIRCPALHVGEGDHRSDTGWDERQTSWKRLVKGRWQATVVQKFHSDAAELDELVSRHAAQMM
jgi:hypothetical protein